MSDRLFYINGEWLTYEQAHSLGYSLLPQRLLTFYDISNNKVSIKQDSSDNTYYDNGNHVWVVDFSELSLYKKVSTKLLYRGESLSKYASYTASIYESSSNYIFYNSLIRSLNDAYENYGITSYSCKNIIHSGDKSPVVWFDSKTSKYFDDRDSRHYWVDSINDIKVTYYNSNLLVSESIYEDDVNNSFFINDEFISRDEFYSSDYNGIVRDTAILFKDNTRYSVYFDSYSNKYCIPNVTSKWLSRESLNSLGYLFIDEFADFWRAEDPLHLRKKEIPQTVTISFTNIDYSDLDIELPNSLELLYGSEIILPSISGIYSDLFNIKWIPVRWDIGEFNSSVILTNNTTVNLICEKLKVTVTFTNTYYSNLEIELPEPITIDNGTEIILPSITGEYEDSSSIKWYPQKWDIGEFGDSVILTDNISINLICERTRVTLSFTNTTRPEFNIQLPASIIRYYGDDILLPTISGLFRDEDGCGFRPVRYDIGSFASLYRTYVDTTADVVWEQIVEMRDNAICGSMPGESILIVSDGIMEYNPLPAIDKPLLYNPEEIDTYTFGGRIKQWDSSYEDHIVVFPEKDIPEQSGQFICGTIRRNGSLANRNLGASDFSSYQIDGFMYKSPLSTADKPLLYNPEIDTFNILSGRIKQWDSSYEDHIIVFPEKNTEELQGQSVTGTTRKSGSLANRSILFTDIDLTDISYSTPLPAADKSLLYNPEDNLLVFTGKTKSHDPTYIYPPVPSFPEKSDSEPEGQFVGGTIRSRGNLANRNILIDGLCGLNNIS